MILLSETFAAQMSGYSFVETVGLDGAVTRVYYDATGQFMGKSVAKISGDKTVTQFFDAQMESLGKEQVTVSDRTVTTVYDSFGQVLFTIKVLVKPDYTVTETFGPDYKSLGFVKEIHTDTTHGVQIYDADSKLVSAHLETDDGAGRVSVADYGPDWVLLSKTTVTTTITNEGSRVITEHQANGAGNVTGGTIVTTKADFTLTETFGPDWVKTGSVKEIHTDTVKGVQIYDANEVLVSAHLESDNGQGVVSVTDYGPGWAVISRTTVTTRVSEGSTYVVTEHQSAGGHVTGGSIVTTKADYTLTETFGDGWVKTGAIKEIHTDQVKGVQVYDGNEVLVSAHLETDDGQGNVSVTDYGPGWAVISRTTVSTQVSTNGTYVVTEHQSAGGHVTGGTIVTTKADFTLTETFGDGWVKTGAIKEIHTGQVEGVQVYDGNEVLVSAHLETDNGQGYTTVTDYGPGWVVVQRTTVSTQVSANGTYVVTEHQGAGGHVTGGTIVTTKPDYTLAETFGDGWVKTGSVKEIHNQDTTGVQVYDANEKLVSAHLETDNGLGVVSVADYGPDWVLLSKSTVSTTLTDEGSRVVTETQSNGVVTGGTIVTTKADFTLTETFGPGWVKTGSVKEIHTATTHGVQIYDANEVLVSGHLETDDGQGNTSVTEYGAGWFVISRKTVGVTITAEGSRIVTEFQANGAGNVTGGTIVTTKADFTLTETFGAGWVLLGSVKQIHTDTVNGVQNYDAAGNLISAHLESDNGQGFTKVEDYGPNWFLISKTTVMVDGDKVTTEHQANGAGNVEWMTVRVGSGETAETRHIGYAVDNIFVGDIGKDTMLGDAGNDKLYGMGNNDDLSGGAGDDYLDGGAADDKLSGNEGNDTLFGGSGNDTLYGGAGTDILIGGAGRDIMSGGGLSDRFVFNNPSETGTTALTRDQITDFQTGLDKIDLSGMDANGSLAGDPAFQFVAAKGAAFTGAAGVIIWSQIDEAGTANDRTIISGDINGDKVADFQIELVGLLNLTQTDIIL